MLYDIRLTIHYDFGQPAGPGRHLLRLLPADLPGVQRVLSAALAIDPPPADRAAFDDFFGNRVVEAALPGGAATLDFTATARVERHASDAGLDLSPPPVALPAALAAARSLAPDSPQHFLGASPRIPPDAAIAAFAAQAAAGASTVRAMVEAVGRALHDAMAFDPAATTVDTPPSEAFARREGVCQDFAQVMIAGLRGLGVPAGYVSGFLRTEPPPGQPRLEGADAMHAWVRAWCGEAGWQEYDPTNACLVGADHIRVAIGRDYAEAAPVAGVLRLAGAQRSHQAVDVIPVGSDEA